MYSLITHIHCNIYIAAVLHTNTLISYYMGLFIIIGPGPLEDNDVTVLYIGSLQYSDELWTFRAGQSCRQDCYNVHEFYHLSFILSCW